MKMTELPSSAALLLSGCATTRSLSSKPIPR